MEMQISFQRKESVGESNNMSLLLFREVCPELSFKSFKLLEKVVSSIVCSCFEIGKRRRRMSSPIHSLYLCLYTLLTQPSAQQKMPDASGRIENFLKERHARLQAKTIILYAIYVLMLFQPSSCDTTQFLGYISLFI